MTDEYLDDTYRSKNIVGVLAGLLVGGLAGAAAMFLLAPRSGAKTRLMIQQKSIELRDNAAEMIEDTFKQAQLDGRKFTRDSRKKALSLMHDGQEMVLEQLEHGTDAAKAGKKAILSS